MLETLVRHGWQGFRSYMVWVKIDSRERIWRTYTGDTLGLIVRQLYNVNNDDFPLYSDMGRKWDTRTAEDIKGEILSKLVGDSK